MSSFQHAVCIAGAVGMLLSGIGSSAVHAETKAGDTELTVGTTFIHQVPDNGDSSSSLFGQGGIGYFFTPSSELQATVNGSLSFNGATTGLYGVNARYNHHFNTSGTFVPYIGPQAGVQFIRSSGLNEQAFSFGGQAGVKAFVTERIAIFGEYNIIRTLT